MCSTRTGRGNWPYHGGRWQFNNLIGTSFSFMVFFPPEKIHVTHNIRDMWHDGQSGRASERVARDILKIDPPYVLAPEATFPNRVEEEDLKVRRPGWAAVIAGSINQRTQVSQRPPLAIGAAPRDIVILTPKPSARTVVT